MLVITPSFNGPISISGCKVFMFIESGIFEEMQELTSTQATQTQAVEPPKSPAPLEVAPSAPTTSTPSSLSKISEYGSCEELEMINGPGR